MTETLAHGAAAPQPFVVPREASVVRQCLDANSSGRGRSFLARLFGLRILSRKAHGLYAEAGAEIAIVRELARLGSAWTIVRQSSGESDSTSQTRVLAGPGGVYILSSVDEPDRDLWVDDFVLATGSHRSDGIHRARKSAKELSALLSADNGKPVRVTPIIVVTAARSVTYANESSRVLVLGVDRLVRWISQRPQTLSESALVQVRAALDPYSPEPSRRFVLDDTLECVPEFELLAGRVRHAQRRFLLWIELAATLAVAAAVVLLIF